MTTDTQAAAPELGKARLRKEDARLVTGQTNWTDNIVLPGMLHMAFVRSPFAHARITSVDVSAARKHARRDRRLLRRATSPTSRAACRARWPVTADIVIPHHPPMATEEVRYVGEAVAVVVARDRYEAADAARRGGRQLRAAAAGARHAVGAGGSSPKVHEAGNKSYEWVFEQGDPDRRVPRRAGGDRARRTGSSG